MKKEERKNKIKCRKCLNKTAVEDKPSSEKEPLIKKEIFEVVVCNEDIITTTTITITIKVNFWKDNQILTLLHCKRKSVFINTLM